MGTKLKKLKKIRPRFKVFKMNLNDLAVEISKREGGKYNMPIAQIKEVLRHLGDIFLEYGAAVYLKMYQAALRRWRRR